APGNAGDIWRRAYGGPGRLITMAVKDERVVPAGWHDDAVAGGAYLAREGDGTRYGRARSRAAPRRAAPDQDQGEQERRQARHDSRRATSCRSAATRTKPSVAAGVAKWAVRPTASWYSRLPLAGSSAYSTPAAASALQSAPPARMGGPAANPAARQAALKEGAAVSTRSATRPDAQGTYTRGGTAAAPPLTPPPSGQTAAEKAAPPRPP